MKPDLFEAEFNKGIALPMSDFRPSSDPEENLFPKGRGH